MPTKIYLHFLAENMHQHRKRYVSILFLATLLVFLLTAVLFISSSLKTTLLKTIEQQADFTVQKYEAGRVANAPIAWIDEFLEFEGVSHVQGRVHGLHYYEPNEQYFTIVGIDIFDEQVETSLKKLVSNIDPKVFLSKEYMIVGSGVRELFDNYEYKDYYTFRPPDRSKQKVYFYSEFIPESDLLTNDIIVMDEKLARKILGLKETEVTDIIISVPNSDEIETIRTKLILSHFNMRIIEKNDVKRYYETLFNYKGGVFLTLYIIVLFGFMLLLYQRYSQVVKRDLKEVAILRLVGWSVKDIIYFKLYESIIVIILAYTLGVILAYIYVFMFGAPILNAIFFGNNNLIMNPMLIPTSDFGMLGSVFFVFAIPYILTVVFPLWRNAIQDPLEGISS